MFTTSKKPSLKEKASQSADKDSLVDTAQHAMQKTVQESMQEPMHKSRQQNTQHNEHSVSASEGFGRDDFEVLERELVYDGFTSLEKLSLSHACYLGGSQQVSRELLVRQNAVAVLLYDPMKDAVVLVEQFRVGAIYDEKGPWMLELVAGLIDTDEPPEVVARRECIEEAGCCPTELTFISAFYLSPGVSSEKLHLYCAHIDSSGISNSIDTSSVHGLTEEGEDIRVHVIPISDAIAALNAGKIDNAITIIGLQWLFIHRHSM